jgi:hypothetical protein
MGSEEPVGKILACRHAVDRSRDPFGSPPKMKLVCGATSRVPVARPA